MFNKLSREQNGALLPCPRTGVCLTLNGVLSFCMLVNILFSVMFLAEYVNCLICYIMNSHQFYCSFLWYTFA